VEHDFAKAHPFAESDPGHRHRPRQIERGAGARQALEVAGRDHLGQHHRDRLEDLFLLLGVAPVGAVLDHEHAERAPRPEDRNPEEGVVDLLAGLREIREGGVGLGVRQVQRRGFGRDQADQALPDPEGDAMDRLALEALGGVELEDAIRAQDIGRADFRDHIGRDLLDDLVEADLRADRLRHDLAEATEEHARPGEWRPHGRLFRE
jgi:hypothetical protein